MHHIHLLHLDKEGLFRLYKKGTYLPELRLNRYTTLLVLDCHELALPKCRSLVIDAALGVVFSERTTTYLINHFIDQQTVDLLFIRTLLTTLFPTKTPCLPFVWGEIALMPLGGQTRHPTSWVMLHHAYHNFLSGPNEVTFIFKQDQTLRFQIPINKKIYTTNLQTTLDLYATLHHFIDEIVTEFNSSLPHLAHLALSRSEPQFFPSAKQILQAQLPFFVGLTYRHAGIFSLEQVQILSYQLQKKYGRL